MQGCPVHECGPGFTLPLIRPSLLRFPTTATTRPRNHPSAGAAAVHLLAFFVVWRLFFFSSSLMPVSDTTYRSSRPSIPSPLSTPSYTASSLASSASPSWPGAATIQKRPPPIDTRSRGNTTPSSAGHTTFFSDSSNPSSPEEESPRCVTKDTTAQCRILCPLRAHPYI